MTHDQEITASRVFVLGLALIAGCAESAGVTGAGAPVPHFAVRPIAPLSTASVTSRRPTLRWALAAEITGAHVDLCRDRACSVIEQSFDAVGTQATPTEDLAPGVHFWRLHGPDAANPGPTWEFFVGHRSAPVDTSWGTVADFNGDGLADVVFGAPANLHPVSGLVYVYMGSAAGTPSTPTMTLSGPGEFAAFGDAVASAGDVDGDGYADLLVGSPGGLLAGGRADLAGRAFLYRGSATGLATRPSTSMPGPSDQVAFGKALASAGDLNGDGYADVVIAPYCVALGTDATGAWVCGTGRAYVYLGSASGLSSQPTTRLDGPSGTGGMFGFSVASAGDVNGDHFADLLVGESCAPATGIDPSTRRPFCGAGRVHLYLGSARGIATTPSTTLSGPDGNAASYGLSVASAGDVNGDGYADVAVGADSAVPTGRAHVYLGSASGLVTTPMTNLVGPAGAETYFGFPVAGGGDVNGDGYGDLIVGASGVMTGTGQVSLYLGSAQGLGETAVVTLSGPDGIGGFFGTSALIAHDLNGDGLADLAVSALCAPWNARTGCSGGRGYVYLGTSLGLAATPAITLVAPGASFEQFGYSLACRIKRSGATPRG